jgi:NADPH:quinone reductase-like Zn-dependent oxidoreductase
MRRALKPGGTFVQVAAAKGGSGVIGRLLAGFMRSRLLRQRIIVFLAKANTDDFMELKGLIEAGKVRPIIDRIHPLHEIADAVAYAATERSRGKVVIRIADAPTARRAELPVRPEVDLFAFIPPHL